MLLTREYKKKEAFREQTVKTATKHHSIDPLPVKF